MKIWKSFSGEHSAKLKIIASFKTSELSDKAADCVNDLIKVEDKSNGNNLYFSDELMKIFDKYNFHNFNENDADQLSYFNNVNSENKKIEIDTDELDIQALVKIFIHFGAKLEIFSKHDYKLNN